MLLLEQILVAGARVDHRRHVDVVEGGQQRGGVLRFLEPRGDGLAQPRHLDALFAAFARRRPEPGAAAAAERLQRSPPAPGRRPAPGALSFALAAASTSSLVSRPSLPVPLIFDGIDMMLEHRAAHRGRQRQRRHRRRLGPRRGAGSSPQRPGSRRRRVGCRTGARPRRSGRSAAATAPPSPIRAITAPTATVSPSLNNCSASMPATGDGTSTATLSVSRLAIGSSSATASPGFFSHCAERRFGDRFAQRWDFHVGRPWLTRVLPLQRLVAASRRLRLLCAQRVGDQGRLLGGVALGKAGRGRSRRRAAGIARRACP